MMCRSPSIHYATSQLSNDIKTSELVHAHDQDMLRRVLEIVEELSARVDSIQNTKTRPPVNIFKPLPKVRHSGVSALSVPHEDSSPVPARHPLQNMHSQPAILDVEKEELRIKLPLDPLHPDVHTNYIKVLETFSHEMLPDNLSWGANAASNRVGEDGDQQLDLQSRYAQAYLLLQCTQAAARNPKDMVSLIEAVNAIALYEMQRVIDIQNEFPYKVLGSDLGSYSNPVRDSTSTLSSTYSRDEAHAPLFLQRSGQVSMESIELQPLAGEASQSTYMPLLEHKVQLMQSPSVPCFKTAGYIEDEITPVYDHTDGVKKHLSIKKCQSALELTSFAHHEDFDDEQDRSDQLTSSVDSGIGDDFENRPSKTPIVLCEAFDEPPVRRNASEFFFGLPRSQSSISSFRPISKSLASARLTKGYAGKNPKFVRSLVKKKESFAKLFANATGKQL